MPARSPRPGSSRSRTTSHPSPYRQALPVEAELAADPLSLRLDFHRESVVLSDYGKSATRTRLVSALEVAHALARELDLTTGLLPTDTLWWAKTASGVRVAVWREPRVWTLRLRERYDAAPRRLRLPMPGLVFVCLPARQAPYVFAAASRPRSPDDQLYACPAYIMRNLARAKTGEEAMAGRALTFRHPGVGELLPGEPVLSYSAVIKLMVDQTDAQACDGAASERVTPAQLPMRVGANIGADG